MVRIKILLIYLGVSFTMTTKIKIIVWSNCCSSDDDDDDDGICISILSKVFYYYNYLPLLI